jgi:hypothetical protein
VGVDEVADQDAGLIAENLVGGIAPAAHRRAVDDVVVEEGGGVDEFDESGGFDMGMAVVSAGTAGEYDQQGAEAFATAGDDVLGDLVDERDGALQARADDLIDAEEVWANQGSNVIQSHRPSRNVICMQSRNTALGESRRGHAS